MSKPDEGLREEGVPTPAARWEEKLPMFAEDRIESLAAVREASSRRLRRLFMTLREEVRVLRACMSWLCESAIAAVTAAGSAVDARRRMAGSRCGAIPV